MKTTLRVSMPDGTKWDVPILLIAQNRASHYKKEFGNSLERSMKEDTIPLFSDDAEVIDWAANNMNWDDVKKHSKRVQPPEPHPFDYQEGWVNGDKELL